jgi:hypothetical protein
MKMPSLSSTGENSKALIRNSLPFLTRAYTVVASFVPKAYIQIKLKLPRGEESWLK